VSAALARPEPPQGNEVKPGDPQVSAVYQCLTHFSGLKPVDCVVDLGSGSGLLATIIADIWKAGDLVPRYVAVDLELPLSALSLPPRIHNNSEKVEFSEFMASRLDVLAPHIRLVVIRNVFHELDILQTAALLTNLNNRLLPGTAIYIQDMAILPNAERGNAGWDPECFSTFLTKIGFSPTMPGLTSRTGINWFFTTLETSQTKLVEAKVAAECASQRRSQKRKMHDTLRQLNPDYEREEAAGEIVYLSVELASIDLQLGTFEDTLGQDRSAREQAHVELGGVNVPLKPSARVAGALAVVTHEQNSVGLVATVRNKEDIDISELITGSKSIVWFAGYSQKLTFQLPENRTAIAEACRRGVGLKFLITDPTSHAAIVRASLPVYPDGSDLIHDIHTAISNFTKLVTEESLGPSGRCAGEVALRMTMSPPPCSYFLIDNLCFMSIYSHHLTGTAAPCLVFSERDPGNVGYYELLREEFRAAFEGGKDVEVSSDEG